MPSTPTNGGGVPAGRLPPQAPSSAGKSSGRKPKGSGRSSRRVRSSSDGVRVMNERYQQQQQEQQYYYNGGGGGGAEGGYYQQPSNYPMQYPNPPPPPAGYGYGPPASPNGKGPNPNYGAMRPRVSSRDSREGFNPMNELTSVIGRSGASARRLGPGAGSVKPKHRRALSDSQALRMANQLPPQPPNMPSPSRQQGGQYVMPNPDFLRPRGNSRDGPFRPGEMDALLAQHQAQQQQAAVGGSPHRSGRPKTHMRQHSVNLYMKSFKGVKQPAACKDVLWSLLFVAQLVFMGFVGLRFGPEALVETEEELGPGEGLEDDDAADDRGFVLAHRNIVRMAYTCGAFAVIVSALALAFMMAMSRRLVYVALVLSIGVSFAWGTIGIGIAPRSFVPVTGIVFLMLTVGYMFVVWDRIPFASANLTAALTGVRDNLGLVGVAFFSQFVALVGSIYYSFTAVGLHDVMRNADAEYDDKIVVAVGLLLLLSYYWTYQVLRHIVMVTVAGTIGSWWFDQPSALKETFAAATFYNFGSICYGSLFVGFVQFLRQITEGLRPNNDDSAMMCLYEFSLFFQEKIVGCVDNLADSFTPWAFTYLGLYHYGLKEAGHKANELFERRGWSRIVTDDLISSVLAMVSLVIGGLSGSFAVILQYMDGRGLTSFGHPILTSFLIGFVVGLVLSTVLFSIIDSSVCAVIVCFAGSPVEFHRNHPELSHEMRNAWKEVWPGSLEVDTVGTGLV